MSSKNRLLQRALQSPQNFHFHELESLLKQYGFRKVKTNAGSHFKWRHEVKILTYMAPRRNPVKAIYIKNLAQLISLHFNTSENDS